MDQRTETLRGIHQQVALQVCFASAEYFQAKQKDETSAHTEHGAANIHDMWCLVGDVRQTPC